MSVYIKGMEMPKNCLQCPLQGSIADCRLTGKTYNWGLSERPSDCPLIPVPEHGRLIDADALYNNMVKAHNAWREHHEEHKSIVPVVDDETMVLYSSTVIEADRGVET